MRLIQMDYLLFEIGVFGYFCVSTEQCSALSDSVLIVLHLHPFVDRKDTL